MCTSHALASKKTDIIHIMRVRFWISTKSFSPFFSVVQWQYSARLAINIFRAVATLRIRRLHWVYSCRSETPRTALIKKKRKFPSYIRKFRRDLKDRKVYVLWSRFRYCKSFKSIERNLLDDRQGKNAKNSISRRQSTPIKKKSGNSDGIGCKVIYEEGLPNI